MISIYISKFPEYSTENELYDIFGCVRDVVEVTISTRRNKVGKIFGLVQFIEKVDARTLVVRVDNIQNEGRKIHANLSRFQRGEKGAGMENMGDVEVKGGIGSVNFSGGRRFIATSMAYRRENRSYA